MTVYRVDLPEECALINEKEKKTRNTVDLVLFFDCTLRLFLFFGIVRQSPGYTSSLYTFLWPISFVLNILFYLIFHHSLVAEQAGEKRKLRFFQRMLQFVTFLIVAAKLTLGLFTFNVGTGNFPAELFSESNWTAIFQIVLTTTVVNDVYLYRLLSQTLYSF